MKVKALFEFWAENEAELSFQVGDVITVVNRDDAGWWEGELNGQKGLFPSNYVEAVADTAQSPTAVHQPSMAITRNPVGNFPPATRGNGAPMSTMPVIGNAQAVRAGPPPISQQHVTLNSGPPPRDVSTAKPAATNGGGTNGANSGGGGGARPAKLRESKTKYGLWSSNMALYSAISMLCFGVCGFVWYTENSDPAPVFSNDFTLYASLYSFFLAILILLWEYFFGQKRGPSSFPARGLTYLALSSFLFLSWVTMLGGCFLACTGLANLAATAHGEVYDAPAKAVAKAKEKKPLTDAESKAEGPIGALKVFWAGISQQNKVGQVAFISLYIIGNVALFAYTVNLWEGLVATSKFKNSNSNQLVPTGWAPFAKGFGALLDLNCALILLPVLRTMIRWLYNRSTADQGCFSTFLRGLLYFIPLDENLAFHKLIAKVIMGATIAHTIVHYINFALRPYPVLNLFQGAWPLISGGIVCLTMFIIYTAAFDNTKRGQFEIFWYSHHAFVLFFIFLFTHGHGGLNPGFWKFFAATGPLYLLERLLRIHRARQRVVVLSCTIMDDVFSLEFAKEGVFADSYKEGQYVFLNAPAISAVQWHPFTISSAPEEKTVTVHIRVSVEGSWTRELCAYISAMGPKGKPFFALDRQGPQGKLMGKILGPDGKPMLCIDGPHSAPTQHIPEYGVAIVVGAGIGATPVSATLKSVVFHRWKYFIGACFPDHAYFMWVCAHRDIDAFRWLIRNIKDAQDEVCHMRATSPQQMASKHFEFHIWVTSVPQGQKPVDVIIGEGDQIGFWGVPREDAKVEKVRANWDEADLYKTMKCPPKHTQLQDVHVWEGRPAWGARFTSVAGAHPHEPIGVAFCGNPMIAKDLKKQCYVQNQTRTKGFFKLHKENF